MGDDKSILGEKLKNQDFLEHIANYDINILTETWCKEPENLQLQNYHIISSKAEKINKKQGRH